MSQAPSQRHYRFFHSNKASFIANGCKLSFAKLHPTLGS